MALGFLLELRFGGVSQTCLQSVLACAVAPSSLSLFCLYAELRVCFSFVAGVAACFLCVVAGVLRGGSFSFSSAFYA